MPPESDIPFTPTLTRRPTLPLSDIEAKTSAGTHISYSQATTTKAQFKAFRISSIPAEIDRDALKDSLLELESDSGHSSNRNSNILALSLASRGRTQVATVIFRCEPTIFSRCTPRSNAEVELDLGGALCQLTVDCDFFGMTALYSSGDDALVEYAGQIHIRIRNSANCYYSIIAITGLAGHAFGSWKSPGGSMMWLRDLLPKDIPQSRIFTYGYDSIIQNSISNSSIQDYARQLMDAVASCRQSAAV